MSAPALKYISIADMNTYFEYHINYEKYIALSKREKIAFARKAEDIYQNINFEIPYNGTEDIDAYYSNTEISNIDNRIAKIDYYFANSTIFNTAFKKAIYETTLYYYLNKDEIEMNLKINNVGATGYSTNKETISLKGMDKIKMMIGDEGYNYLSTYLPAKNRIRNIKYN